MRYANLLLATRKGDGSMEYAFACHRAGSIEEATAKALRREVGLAKVREALESEGGLSPDALFPEAGGYYCEVQSDGMHTEAGSRRTGSGSNSRAFAKLLRALRFRVCDRCGRWLSPTMLDAESTWDRAAGERVCNACRENDRSILVNGYHRDDSRQAGTETVIADNGTAFSVISEEGETAEERALTVGFELEACAPDRALTRNDRFEAIPDYWAVKDHFKHERDGSLSDGGLEFVTQVFTLGHFRRSADVEAVCSQAKALGADDRDPHSGLHVHVSKKFLGDTPAEQSETALKIEAFINEYESDFVALSGRNPGSMGYCALSSARSVDDLFAEVKACLGQGANPFGQVGMLRNNHSRAVNFRGMGATMEMRIYKSTTDPVALRDAVEFTVGLVTGLRKTPFRKIFVLGKALRDVPADTMARLRAKGCFCRTHAQGDTRGRAF